MEVPENSYKEELKRIVADIIDESEVKKASFSRHTKESPSKYPTLTKIDHTDHFDLVITFKSKDDLPEPLKAVKDLYES